MNKQVLELIENAAWEQLNADPDFNNALAKCNRAVEKLMPQVGMHELAVLEDALIEGGRQMAKVLLPLALEIGRNPGAIFDLPELD